MKSMWKENAWPAFAMLLFILSIFVFAFGLAIAFRPESVDPTLFNLPLYIRVLAGIGGTAITVGARLSYYRAIGRI